MKVSIYEWKNEQLSDKIQDIPITSPYRCNTFIIHNITYMACGKGWSRTNAITVLKWSGKQSEPFQDLPSSYEQGRPNIIHANGTVYLASANCQNHRHSPDIESFTDGTASSSSTTSPSWLLALWVGIPSQLLLVKCSSSWPIAKHGAALVQWNLQFTRWLTINSTYIRNCQLLRRNTYTLSHTRASNIWRWTSIKTSATNVMRVQCTYGIERLYWQCRKPIERRGLLWATASPRLFAT